MWLLFFLACTAGLDPSPGPDAPVRGELLGIGIAPNDPILEVGDSVTFQVKSFYDDTTNEDITDAVSYQTTDPRVLSVSPSGVATALAVGQASVIATDETGLSARVTVTVNGPGATLVSLEMAPEAVELGLDETLQLAVIASYDDGSEGNIASRCTWTSSDPAVSVDSLGAIEGEATGAATVTAACEPGTVTAAVTVVSGAPTGAPDLVVQNPAVLVDGDTVTYTVTVENLGDAQSSGFYVDGFLDESTAPTAGNDGYDTTQWVPTLAAGASVEVTLELAGVSAGDYRSWLYADADEWIAESDESNNVAGPLAVSVAGQNGGPNLVIGRFEGLTDGGYSFWEIVVRNDGDGAAGPFYVDLFYDTTVDPQVCDYGDDYVDLPGLDAGQSYLWEPDVSDGPFSSWRSVVYVDTCDDVTESSETDNQSVITLQP